MEYNHLLNRYLPYNLDDYKYDKKIVYRMVNGYAIFYAFVDCVDECDDDCKLNSNNVIMEFLSFGSFTTIM
jgi:hypothetical protein